MLLRNDDTYYIHMYIIYIYANCDLFIHCREHVEMKKQRRYEYQHSVR